MTFEASEMVGSLNGATIAPIELNKAIERFAESKGKSLEIRDDDVPTIEGDTRKLKAVERDPIESLGYLDAQYLQTCEQCLSLPSHEMVRVLSILETQARQVEQYEWSLRNWHNTPEAQAISRGNHALYAQRALGIAQELQRLKGARQQLSAEWNRAMAIAEAQIPINNVLSQIPEWQDEKVMRKEVAIMARYARKRGIMPQQLGPPGALRELRELAVDNARKLRVQDVQAEDKGAPRNKYKSQGQKLKEGRNVLRAAGIL